MDEFRFDIPRYLSLLPLFNELRPDELTRLAEGCQLHRYARGDMVCRLGEPCEGFHVVVTGQVKLSVLSPAGQEKVVELAGPGHTFGEALVFSDRPYVVSVQTLADSTLLAVSKRAVYAEIAADPKFALRMLAGMSRRLHGLINDVQSYTLASGMQRIIGYLLRELAEEDQNGVNVAVTLPTNKGVIASRLNLTQEHFSRILHELSELGLIVVEGRKIHIPSVVNLRKHEG